MDRGDAPRGNEVAIFPGRMAPSLAKGKYRWMIGNGDTHVFVPFPLATATIMEISPQTLATYSLFAGIKEDVIEYLMQHMEVIDFKKGEMLFRDGDHGSEICFLLSGKVQVVKSGVVLAELQQGEQFGEMYMIDMLSRSADVIGSESGRFINLNHRELLDFRQKDQESFILFLLNCGRDISRRLRRMNELYVQLHKQAKDE